MMTRSVLAATLMIIATLALSALAAPANAALDVRAERLEFDPARVTVAERDGVHVVKYPRALSSLGRPGEPALPTQVVQIEIPANRNVSGVRVDVLEVESVASGLTVAPVTRDHQVGQAKPPVTFDAGIYASSAVFPQTIASFTGRTAMRGHTIATIHVTPWIYQPDSGELELITRLELHIELEEADRMTLERYRIDADIEARFERGAGSAIRGELVRPMTDGGGTSHSAFGGGEGVAAPGPYQPTFRPTTDGSPIEYLIITSEDLAPEFERLAEWKTKKGVQAAVRTVEWIDATYPNGVDGAERLRFFIRDAYQNWGTLWVLLGGDTDVVPFRYAETTLLGGESIPADYYFMCLEGNWNLDGDERFGEGQFLANDPVDDVDLGPEVIAGRAPVSSLEEAQVFVDKNLTYEQNPPTANGYPASVLFLAERLFEAFDGASIAEEASALFPPWFKQVKLYEEFQDWPGSLPLTLEAAVDSVNNGFGMVHHVGHGFRNTMSVGENSLTNADADNFTNGDRQPFVFGINCSSASIDFNSIGERWVKNPNGGAVAYYGTSRFAFVNSSSDIQEEWFSVVFEDSLWAFGEGATYARLPFLGTSVFDNAFRWTMFALTLIGDPETVYYTNDVVPMTVTHAGTHEIGSGPLAVSVTSAGSPLEGAIVTAWRDGEFFAEATTNASGDVSLDIPAENAGDFDLTVSKTYYRPYLVTVTLTSATGPYAFVESVVVDDDVAGMSSGDSDGLADVGETVELAVTLKNGGAATLTGANAVITVDDPGGHLTLDADTVSYGTLSPGGTSQGASRFVVTIAPTAPDAFQPVFAITITANEGSWSDLFVLPVRRSTLEHHAHVADDAVPRGNGNGVIEAGEDIYYTIDLRNTGQEDARSVDAALRVLRISDGQVEPLVTVNDDQMAFGDLAVGSIVTGDRFEFAIDGSLDPADLQLEVTFTDVYAQTLVQLLDMVNPGVPDSMRAFGSPTSITLKWNRPTDVDVMGYDVYRSDLPSGPFTQINDYMAEGSAVFEDIGLPPLTRFYYQIVARDSSFNEGPVSEVFSGTTNPPQSAGWPIATTQSLQSSVQIADLEGDWEYEVFTAADYQYGWRGDATEIVDGDDDPRTSGVISPLGFDPNKGFGATTAIGDVDGDGTLEICNVGWTVKEVYLWDVDGNLLPGWPKDVLGDFNWASPVLADVDIDGDLEVIVWAANGGRLFGWHHDGTEIVDGDSNPGTDGIMRRVFGISFNFSSPAVGNLDGDPQLEIVFCSNLASSSTDPQGGVFAINIDGTDVTGWPVMTGDEFNSSQITASPAIVNLDGAGGNEVVVTSEREGGRLHVFQGDGTDLPGWPVSVSSLSQQVRVASPVIADIDNDQGLDVVLPASDGNLYVFDAAGNVLPNFPVTFLAGVQEPTQSTPSVGDLDDDGFLEILFGDEKGKVLAYNHDGTPVDGFPIQLNGEVRSTPVMWDIDNDSLVEVCAAGWDQNVYVWDLPFAWRPDRQPWPFFRHDARNTGFYGTPIQIAVDDAAPAPIARAVVHAPFPNPFNPRTRFDFEVPGERATAVDIAVYDVGGRLVRQLISGLVDAGTHSVEWDGRMMDGRVANTGVYFYRAAIGGFATTGKLTLLK